MKQKLIAAWTHAKQEAIKLEVWVKSAVMAALGGGLDAAHTMYNQGITFAATHEHLVVLKAKFLAGAVTGVIAYWLKRWPSNLNQNPPSN